MKPLSIIIIGAKKDVAKTGYGPYKRTCYNHSAKETQY